MSDIQVEVRVSGLLSPSALEELEELVELRASLSPPSTVLSGVVADQAALLGLLTRLRGLGLDVTELRRVPRPLSAREGRDD